MKIYFKSKYLSLYSQISYENWISTPKKIESQTIKVFYFKIFNYRFKIIKILIKD